MNTFAKVLALLCILCAPFTPAAAETTVSEKAQRFFDRGTVAIKTAESPADFRDAAAEFHKASAAAPSWPDPYYNEGVALEKAGDPAGAYKAFKNYQKAAPDASDTRQVRQKINELEYLAEKQSKERTAVMGKKSGHDKLLKSLEGAVYVDPTDYAEVTGAHKISRGKLLCGTYTKPGNSFGAKPGFFAYKETSPKPFGENLEVDDFCGGMVFCTSTGMRTSRTVTLSEDGETQTNINKCPGAYKFVFSRLK